MRRWDAVVVKAFFDEAINTACYVLHDSGAMQTTVIDAVIKTPLDAL